MSQIFKISASVLYCTVTAHIYAESPLYKEQNVPGSLECSMAEHFYLDSKFCVVRGNVDNVENKSSWIHTEKMSKLDTGS